MLKMGLVAPISSSRSPALSTNESNEDAQCEPSRHRVARDSRARTLRASASGRLRGRANRHLPRRDARFGPRARRVRRPPRHLLPRRRRTALSCIIAHNVSQVGIESLGTLGREPFEHRHPDDFEAEGWTWRHLPRRDARFGPRARRVRRPPRHLLPRRRRNVSQVGIESLGTLGREPFEHRHPDDFEAEQIGSAAAT
jgi:hypothetical protein